jgi:hypothetical protein
MGWRRSPCSQALRQHPPPACRGEAPIKRGATLHSFAITLHACPAHACMRVAASLHARGGMRRLAVAEFSSKFSEEFAGMYRVPSSLRLWARMPPEPCSIALILGPYPAPCSLNAC